MSVPKPRDKAGKPKIPCRYAYVGCKLKFHTKDEAVLHSEFCDKAPKRA